MCRYHFRLPVYSYREKEKMEQQLVQAKEELEKMKHTKSGEVLTANEN